MTEIICISGKPSRVKENIAVILKEELERRKKRVLVTHFADPLKQICREWFGWDGRNDAVGCSLLEYVGTEIVRAQRPDFWVDFTLGLLSIMGDEWDFVIIPDCRFQNELDNERYGFQPWHIRVEGNAKHTQEACMLRQEPHDAPPDFIVAGRASLDDPRETAAAIARRITEKDI